MAGQPQCRETLTIDTAAVLTRTALLVVRPENRLEQQVRAAGVDVDAEDPDAGDQAGQEEQRALLIFPAVPFLGDLQHRAERRARSYARGARLDLRPEEA